MDRKKLLIFFGMTAAGKSFLAGKWSEKTGCPYYNTDIVRKKLAGDQAVNGLNEELYEGIYSKDFTRKTYDELAKRARDDFRDSITSLVVLDGSYNSERERNNVVDVFSDVADIFFIYCYCDEDLVRERLKQRASDPNAVSDGRWEVFLMQKKTFLVPEIIAGARLLLLNTDEPVERLINEVDRFIN